MEKSIFITGAASGIGRAATIKFASHGYQVFATYRSDSALEELKAIPNVYPIKMDVTDPADLERAYEIVANKVGEDGLYALLNNAGIAYSAPFEFVDEKHAREVMDTNFMAPYLIAQKFIPLLVAYNNRGGVKSRVVNVASWAGVMASPYIGFYNASKSALIGLSESMFYDLGLLNIHTVLAIPGITKTPLLAKTTEGGTASLATIPVDQRHRYQALLDHYAGMSASSEAMPMLATPEKVARKLFRLVEKSKPRFRNNLSIDAMLVDKVMTRLPWKARVAMNTRMYKLKLAQTPA